MNVSDPGPKAVPAVSSRAKGKDRLTGRARRYGGWQQGHELVVVLCVSRSHSLPDCEKGQTQRDTVPQQHLFRCVHVSWDRDWLDFTSWGLWCSWGALSLYGPAASAPCRTARGVRVTL